MCVRVCPARVATQIFEGLITARRIDARRSLVLAGGAGNAAHHYKYFYLGKIQTCIGAWLDYKHISAGSSARDCDDSVSGEVRRTCRVAIK